MASLTSIKNFTLLRTSLLTAAINYVATKEELPVVKAIREDGSNYRFMITVGNFEADKWYDYSVYIELNEYMEMITYVRQYHSNLICKSTNTFI
jgi:hypothetical protein